MDETQTKINLTKFFVPTSIELPKTPSGIIETLELLAKGTLVKEKWFVFEDERRFDKEIASLETQANKKLSDYESQISTALLRKVEDTATGLGFKPTVRNMLAVIMASAEGFIRLLDDVHTNAWDVKYDPVRKQAILNDLASAPS